MYKAKSMNIADRLGKLLCELKTVSQCMIDLCGKATAKTLRFVGELIRNLKHKVKWRRCFASGISRSNGTSTFESTEN